MIADSDVNISDLMVINASPENTSSTAVSIRGASTMDYAWG